MIYDIYVSIFIHSYETYILEVWGKCPLDLYIFMGLTDYKFALVLVMVWCHADDQS